MSQNVVVLFTTVYTANAGTTEEYPTVYKALFGPFETYGAAERWVNALPPDASPATPTVEYLRLSPPTE